MVRRMFPRTGHMEPLPKLAAGKTGCSFTSPGRRPDIQGLRAVAVLIVVAFHAGLPVPGGFVGVDVFFVISGFVITGMLRREWQTAGRISFGKFYLRRFQRLFPALALVVVVTMLISVAVLSPLGPQQTAAKTGIGAILIVANVVIARTTGGYFDADAHSNPLLHTWSLSVEEQFYLIFPALIALGWSLASRGRKSRTAPYLLVGIITASSLGLACFGSLVVNQLARAQLLGRYGPWLDQLSGFYSPLTRTWEFAFGVLLALAAGKCAAPGRHTALAFGALGATLTAGSLWLISDTTPFPSAWTLIPVIGALSLIAAGTVADNGVTRLLSVVPMVKVGDWSYSIYLWHWPFIVVAQSLWPNHGWAPLLAALVSFVPAIASYRWLETPIRNLRGLHGRRAAKLVATTVSVPLLVCLSTLVATRHGYWSPGVRSMQAAVQLQLNAVCTLDNDGQGDVQPCAFNSKAQGKPIYLVGDSTATHLSGAAIGAGELLGRPVRLLTIPLCQFKNVFTKAQADDPIIQAARVNVQLVAGCRERYETAMQWLVKQPDGAVIIANLNQEYQGSAIEFGPQPDALTRSPSELVGVLNEGLASTVTALQNAGHQVLIVQAAPAFRGQVRFDPYRCTWNQLRTDRCVARMSRREADSIQQTQRPSLETVATATGAGLWDAREFFCPQAECSTQGYGINLYRDEIHISAGAAKMLAPSLAEALTELPPSPAK